MSIRLVRVVATGALLAAASLVSWAGPSAAAGPANNQIAGVGTFDDDVECIDVNDLFTIEMTGSLDGCWYTTALDVVQETPSGIYQERGTELFIGCFYDDGRKVGCGSFETTYKFTAKFAPDGSEIHGRCQHPIAAGSGTGVFEGATGRVDFKDNVDTGEFNYRGHVKLG